MSLKIKLYQLLTVAGLLLSSISFGQFSDKKLAKLDSLERLTSADHHDTTRVWAFLDMLDLMYAVNKDTIKPISDKVVDISTSALQKSNLQPKEEHRLKKALGDAYANLAYYFSYKGDNLKSSDYNFKSLKIRESISDTYGLANSYNNIGSYYNKQDIPDLALNNYRLSLIYRKKLGDSSTIALCYNNMAYCFSEMKQIDSSLFYYKKSLEIYRLIDNKIGIARSLTNIGAEYLSIGNRAEAIIYLKEGYDIRKKRGWSSGLAYSAYNLASYYYKEADYLTSEKFAQESYDIAFEIDHLILKSKASHILSKLYKKKGKYKDALQMFEQSVKFRDSLKNLEAQKSIIQKELSYSFEKQMLADSIQAAEHQKISAAQLEAEKVKNEKKEQQATFLYLGIGLLALFGFFAFRSFLNAQKQKRIIESQKHIVEEKNKEIIDSIEYAKRIQDAILPSKQTIQELLPNSFILYKPKDIVAGDFYWIEPLESKGVLFAAADCTGHGVPGAMVSVICNNGLNRSVREHGLTEPGEILDKTRQIVVAEFEKSEAEVKDGMDIALCALSENQLKYSGANNPLWVIRKGGVEIEEIKADKQPIGKFDFEKPFTTHSVDLNTGDSVYIFSDGFADQFGGEKGKKFKGANFKKLLLSIQHLSLAEQKIKLDSHFEDWRGQIEQIDDICIIGVKI